MITIDGSHGEGGGQILRTALSLSCLFRKPFRMSAIRKGRPKPGLMPQHLAGVRAAQLLCRGEARGAAVGSTELTFIPGEVRGGTFAYDIGTAGATSLLLQTMIPALAFCGEESAVTLSGGTHVPFSPPFHYLTEVFAPFLRRIGIAIDLAIESHGFYPRGGGRIRARILPGGMVKPLRVADPGRMVRLRGVSAVGNLPLAIAERQRKAALEAIRRDLGTLDPGDGIELAAVGTPGQGTFLFLCAESENAVAGFVSLGARGKRAEAVGGEAASALSGHVRTGMALDPWLADQIVLYLAFCPEESSFTTSCITRHLETNLWTIGRFREFRYVVDGEAGKPGRVRINPGA